MKEECLPVCFFPTTVVMVDDDATYLHNLTAALAAETTCFKTFAIPMRAVDYFKRDYNFNPFTNRCLQKPEADRLEHHLVEVDVRKIHREIYNSERFSQISILIADYSMPGMDGLELCQQIKKGPIKKILLTGEADENLAVEAFNDGIIDKFIRKSDRSFYDVVNGAISELQYEYFQNISKVVINALTADALTPLSCLTDAVFMRYFHEICNKYDIVEYYLMDSSGSFLLLNSQAKPIWLAVKSEAEVRDLYEFALSEDANEEVLQALNGRSEIPYFHTDAELQTAPCDWKEFMHAAHLVQGKELYYCALITDSGAYDINGERVKPFESYSDLDLGG